MEPGRDEMGGNGSENKADRSGYWLERVEYDLETAKAMQQTGRYLYVGFMCQQVAEKALKAVIARQGVFPPKIHHLMRLAELAGVVAELDDDGISLLTKLYPFSLESRYPSEHATIARMLTKEKCAGYISQTEAFAQWIKKKL